MRRAAARSSGGNSGAEASSSAPAAAPSREGGGALRYGHPKKDEKSCRLRRVRLVVEAVPSRTRSSSSCLADSRWLSASKGRHNDEDEDEDGAPVLPAA